MDIFTQRRLAVALIVVLVILNIGTMSLLWLRQMQKPGPPPRPEPTLHARAGSASLLKEELGLNDQQFEEYLTLRQKHRDRTRGISEEIHTLKRRMFDQVFADEPDTMEVNRMLQMVAERQMILEQMTFAHLEDLKELCGEGQQEKLRKLLDEFFRSTGNLPR